jgi:hypothetical protein
MVLEHNHRSTWISPWSIETEFKIENGYGLRSVGIGWGDMKLPGIEDPLNFCQSDENQKLGNIACILSLYDKMRRK